MGHEALPVPVTSFDQMRSDLDEFGYCLMADALSPAQVLEIKTRLLDQAQAEQRAGVALRDGGPMPWQKDLPKAAPNQRVMNLLDKGQEFWQLLLHPIVDEIICHLLGENVISSSVTANITHPGSQPMPLHSDQGYVDIPITNAVVCNTMWMLTDYTAENGGLPHSSQSPAKPDARQTVRFLGMYFT